MVQWRRFAMKLWRTLRPLVRPLVYRLRNRTLYRLASFYVNVVDNDHDNNFHTNGEARFARERLPGASVVFDVGAAKGAWANIALGVNPAAKLYCFEPTSRRFAVLAEALGGRAVLEQLALGDAPGEQRIFYGAAGGSNSLIAPREKASDSELIRVTTIDAYCREHRIDAIDFIKMDIEGYEHAALRGAEGMLRAGKIGVVQFEYGHSFLGAGTSLMALMDYVHGVNPAYTFFKLFPDQARPVREYDSDLENFKTQNWAIIKTGR
jgi:FkbM family methyltransferase